MSVKARFAFLTVSVVVVAVVAAIASGAAQTAGRGIYRLVGMFGQVVALVRANYVEEVPVEKLQGGAMTGLVETADPGGSWVPEASAKGFAAFRERALPPFGLVLGKRSSYPFVLQVLPGSPADRAGILPGELIERMGDDPVRARPLWLAQVLLDEGEKKGGELGLDVIDRALEGKRRVVLKTGPEALPAAKVVEQGGVPVVRVPVVGHDAVTQLEGGLDALGRAPALVVDLRGVALGKDDDAAALAALLAGGDVSLRMDRRDGDPSFLKASGPPRPWKIVVCLDATTAGPAELLAVALKGRGATLVGGESYGDTGRREPIKAAGGQLWLADRWCAGPDGKPVLGAGVKPDEVVRPRKGADAVLERALEIARGGALRQAA